LVEVGLGRIHAGDVRGILVRRDRQAAGTVAPPHGLVLWEVGYPEAVSVQPRSRSIEQLPPPGGPLLDPSGPILRPQVLPPEPDDTGTHSLPRS
jgi:hypothetical protein